MDLRKLSQHDVALMSIDVLDRLQGVCLGCSHRPFSVSEEYVGVNRSR
jgi:hypothetical protein